MDRSGLRQLLEQRHGKRRGAVAAWARAIAGELDQLSKALSPWVARRLTPEECRLTAAYLGMSLEQFFARVFPGEAVPAGITQLPAGLRDVVDDMRDLDDADIATIHALVRSLRRRGKRAKGA